MNCRPILYFYFFGEIMIDLFKDNNTDDIIKQSIQVHDIVLEKKLSKS